VQFSERTLADLAFAEIAAALSSRCQTEPGKQRALVLSLSPNAEEVRRRLTLVEEARKLAGEELMLPWGGVTDLRSAVERASKSAALEARELISIARLLFSFIRIKDLLFDWAVRVPSLAAIAQNLPSLKPVAARIDVCIEPSAEISDRASAELRQARARARALHLSIKSKIDGMLRDEKLAPNLREPYFSLRSGRYVLPILAASRAEVPGIVHNASQSGQTLFVEPEALISQDNELAIAESVVLEEEQRILLELSQAVGRNQQAISAGLDAAAELDVAEASARLASELGAATPQLEDPQASLQLADLRHPLLLLRRRQVVPNELALTGEVRSLVISGPNAGGKTATLTAVGLCALMVRAGLQVPVAPHSRMPLYESIHTVMGDAQDLSHDLSTFSAHVERLRDVAAAAGPGALVLIDEIAADTDPREGGALAISVLEDLINRGVTALVTTHLEEVKALAHADRRFLNARVGFDPVLRAPTYRLRLGEAGTSSAIEIAERVGLSPQVCQRARELVHGAAGPFSKALAELEQRRLQLSEAEEQSRRATQAAQSEQAALSRERLEFQKQRQDEELRARELLVTELEAARSEIRTVLEKLQEEKSLEAASLARETMAARMREEQGRLEQLRQAQAPIQPQHSQADIRVGGWVRHPRLNADVEILELSGEEAVVSAGVLKTRVPLSELVAARGRRPKLSPRQTSSDSVRKAEQAAPAEWTEPERRCDLRGLRFEEAAREVELFLDRLARAGEKVGLIIHGHGTGALKNGIRELLSRSPYVRLYRPGDGPEGGDGVTVVGLHT
jgi:DNA mismatch repair protein MutS2